MQPVPDRELQVLDAAARGLTVQQTGAELYLSANTIKTYRRHVLVRYGARSMTQAVAMWAAEGTPADVAGEAVPFDDVRL